MASSCGLSTSDAAYRGRASSSRCWRRRANCRSQLPRAKTAADASQYRPAKEKIFKRRSTRRSRRSSRQAAAASQYGRNYNRQPNRKMRKWEAREEEQLSHFILGFKLSNGRLPVGVKSSGIDKDFWNCLQSHVFNGHFTYKQLREKMHSLHRRFMQISSGSAKSIRLSERHSYLTWCLITGQASAPAGADAAGGGAAADASNLHSNQCLSTPPIIYPPRHVHCPPPPSAATAHYSPHQAPPVSSVTGTAGDDADSTAEGINRCDAKFTKGFDAELEEIAPGHQYFQEHDSGSYARNDNDEDQPIKVVQAAETTAARDNYMQEKLGEGSWKSTTYKGYSAEGVQTQYEKKEESNMEDGNVSNEEASTIRGGGGRADQYDATKSTSLQHSTTIADLASTTKVLAEATLCTATTTKLLAEATVAATSTTSTLAHTTNVLAQMLLINHIGSGDTTSGVI